MGLEHWEDLLDEGLKQRPCARWTASLSITRCAAVARQDTKARLGLG